MNRQEEIFEIARRVLSEQSQINYWKICENYNRNKEKILADFYQAVHRLIELTKIKQEVSGKRAIKYVAASYLLSSSITGTFEFQLSLLDDQYFCDPAESCLYWSPKWLFETVASDWDMLLKSVRTKVIRLHPYELDFIWRSYICEFYNGLTFLFFAEHLKNAAIEGDLRILSLSEEVLFTYGGYMDHFIQIDTWKRENEE
ncbi:MAG: hypothetical protein NC489_37675 [Ruminococcus flavefaciens]|nr:hypothetical protein [Ruminococcus flavefaciens]